MTITSVPPAPARRAIDSGLTRVLRRIEIYESDGETLWVPDNRPVQPRLIDGSISVDYNRNERRTLDVSLANYDNRLASRDGEGFWYDKILKVYRGCVYFENNVRQKWEVQMGEYHIDNIKTSANDTQVRVVARDPWKKLMNSKLPQSMSFPHGTYLSELVRSLAANAGIHKLRIPYTNETIGSTMDLERGTERGEVIKQACTANNYDVYFDNEGYLKMEKFSDPSTSAPTARFSTGVGGNIVTYDKSINDSRLYNHILVYGDRESVEGGDILMPYFGEAINDNPNSPTSVDRLGDRQYSYASSFFTSDQQCQNYAESLLKIHSLETYEINWSSIYYPWLEVGTVVEVSEPDTDVDIDTRFLLDTISYPLSLGPMSATGKRVLIVR